MNEWCVFLSLETGSVKFPSSQMSIRLSQHAGLSEIDRGFMFFESSFLGSLELFRSFKL